MAAVACSGSHEDGVLGAKPGGSGDASTDAGTGPTGDATTVPTNPNGLDDAGNTSDGAGPGPGTDAGISTTPDAGTSCVPDDRADCNDKCGTLRGRCGALLDCGGCLTGETCGAAGANQCGVGQCVPDCANKACGASDGCGSLCGAGSCDPGLRCVRGTCQCDATSCGNGCCSGGRCETGTTVAACGSQGATCSTCGANQACSLGACVAAACPVGKVACAAGCCTPVLGVAESSACALDRGTLVCWGSNSYGQLATSGFPSNPGPVVLPNATFGVQALAGGQYSWCALTDVGGVKCWGDNGLGQTGSGSTASTTEVVDVTGLSSGVVGLSGSFRHFCAVLSGGAVKCWGAGTYGKLGNGSTSESRVPVDVLSLGGPAVSVAPGELHTCAVLASGAVKCWGGNMDGALGTASTADSLLPTDVFGLNQGVKAISAGASHTCALTNAGGVKCWGSNSYGQLGTGSTANSFVPVDVPTLTSGVEALTAGGNFTCALLTTGAVKCWGSNANGQIGNASTSNVLVPSVVATSDKFASIVANASHACGIREDGALLCWGSNSMGQNGNGTTSDNLVPTPVATTCTPSSCSAGCCSTGRCVAGASSSSCGSNGGACTTCVGNTTCRAGVCGCTFPYTACSTGCCFLQSPDGGSITPMLVAPQATGAVATGTFVLARANVIPRLGVGIMCPLVAGQLTDTNSAALYVEIRNESFLDKTVSIWTSQAAGGPVVDTIMAVYAGATPPITDAQRLQCLPGTKTYDRCNLNNVPTACANDFAGILFGDGTSSGITIPGFSSVTVYVADYFGTTTNDMPFVLSVRTER